MFLFCSFHQLSIDMYFYIILTKNKPSILGYLNVSYFFKNQNKFGWLKFNCSHFGFCKFFPCRLTVLFKLSKNLCFFCLSSTFVSLLGFHQVTSFAFDPVRSDIQILKFAWEKIVKTNSSTLLNISKFISDSISWVLQAPLHRF